MRIALYIEDGLEQIVLTPESETETGILGKLHDGSRELAIHKGSFFDCRGGWKRHTPFEPAMASYGSDRGDESTMIVLTPPRKPEPSIATYQKRREGKHSGWNADTIPAELDPEDGA